MFRGWIHIFLVKWLLPPTETYFGGQNIFAIRWQLTPDYNLGRWQSLGKDAWQDSQGTSTPGNILQGRHCMIIQMYKLCISLNKHIIKYLRSECWYLILAELWQWWSSEGQFSTMPSMLSNSFTHMRHTSLRAFQGVVKNFHEDIAS